MRDSLDDFVLDGNLDIEDMFYYITECKDINEMIFEIINKKDFQLKEIDYLKDIIR